MFKKWLHKHVVLYFSNLAEFKFMSELWVQISNITKMSVGLITLEKDSPFGNYNLL